MLPAELSEGVVSLNPGVDRRAVVLQVPLAADGSTAAPARALRARIRSQAKLSFPSVQRFFDAPADSPLAGAPFAPSLALLARVGALLRAQAAARHVVDVERLGTRVAVDAATGALVGEPESGNDCERFNAQISILCNVQAALLLGAAGDSADGVVQPIFKVCAPPDALALRRLRHDIDDMVRDAGVPPAAAAGWRWDGEAPLQEFQHALPGAGAAGGGPRRWERLRAAINRQATLASGAATYAAKAAGHYGVGAAAYTRFTAPMREVVGVFVHKELLEALEGRGGDPAADRALRDRVIAAAAAAKAAQSAATKAAYKVFLDGLLAADLARAPSERPWRTGTVMGRKANLTFLTLDDPLGAEVKLYGGGGGGSGGGGGGGAAAAPAPPHHAQLRTGTGARVRVLAYDESAGRWAFESAALEEPFSEEL
jgi:ribonuclease R